MLGDLLSRVSIIGRSLTPDFGSQESLIDRVETLLSGRGEATGLALGREILDRYNDLGFEAKEVFFADILVRFGVDDEALNAALEAWQVSRDKGVARRIHFASEPRSQELIRVLNRAPGGTQDLVSMRSDLLRAIKNNADLSRLDDDFSHLFSSWFNRGFLELKRIDWDNTPARILEKIITYEAVHEIEGWDELRLRVAADDRRLYGFFHPALGVEPLIFVEVAMTENIPEAIAPILAEQRVLTDPDLATTAVFYSISNCQKGLRGISFGNFLIKQVVEELRGEFTNLNTFVTLSPIPGLSQWSKQLLDGAYTSEVSESVLEMIRALSESTDASNNNPQLMKELAVHYLLKAKDKDGNPLDPVARFHLGNGACLHQINIAADASERGMSNSFGVMVNYLYDLKSIERNHEAFANEQHINCSSSVQRILK